jgi:hypothetical protein
MRKSVLRCLATCLVLAGATPVFAVQPQRTVANRGEIIAGLMDFWQHRILTENLPVENPRNWSLRNAPKFARLTDAQLQLAQRAETIGELELLFIDAPLRDGTSLGSLARHLPGNLTIVSRDTAARPKADPTGSPTLYDDLVFTAVTPCRIYDSRLSEGFWNANTTHLVRIGPYSDYSNQGGQAVACLGSLVENGQIAAVMTSVSTVNQTGAGYLVFFPSGAANPNPYGVAQWFQPGYVQTSFVVMPTNMIGPVWSEGYIGNAGSHVIVDVIGYFAQPKAVALDCILTGPASLPISAGASVTVYANACPAGYTSVGIQCGSDSYLTWLAANSEFDHCAYHNSDVSTANVRAYAKCCRTAGR